MLTPWDEEAIAALHTMHNSPDVQRYLDAKGLGWSRAKARERVTGWQAEFATLGLGKFPLRRREDGAFVGRAGFSVIDDMAPELGYSLDAAYWGRGYATEIAAALRDWYFQTRDEDHFIAFAHVDNAASQRILEKLGMMRTHTAEIADMPHQFYVLYRTAR
nr:GNAT family N-acetyltransferase [Pelagibacterium limicola]